MRCPAFLSRLTALLALGLLVAGCSSSGAGYQARFNAPADIVKFTGITKKNLGLHDYFAVASARGGDLVFVDAWDNRPVASPGAVYSLSVTTDPRPVRLAAASLGDAGGADLLVAVSAGRLDLQVIETWSAANRVAAASSVALGSVIAEAEILSVTAFTLPAGSTTGRARVLAGLTGGRLVVVDFTRDAKTGAVVPGTPVVKSIGVDARSIAVDSTTLHAYLATTDPLPASGTTPVYGVAWVDAGLDPSLAWPVGSIDARGPTNALAVAHVNERLVDPSNVLSAETFETTARFRIYAILDPSGCGTDRAINCGVAMLDESGILPDPSGEAPYRAPLPVPGIAAGIAIMYPPTSGSGRLQGDTWNPSLPLMLVQPSARNTSAVAAVTSSDGALHIYDLGRFSPVNTGSALTTGLGIYNAASWQPADATDPTSANYAKPMYLGVWNDFPIPPASGVVGVVTDPAFIRFFLQVTPGYTPSDYFYVTWQGEIPGLLARRGVIGRAPTGETYVALQANLGTSAQPTWATTVSLSEPGLGVHGGDLVVLTLDDGALCATNDPKRPNPEVTIATDGPFLAADPALFPAGAVKIAPGSCFEQRLAPGQSVTGSFTFRAAGLILSSGQLGYLGRPVLDQTFVLAHQDESQLTGEALAIARKLRRSFYPAEVPCPPRSSPTDYGCFANFPLIWDPFAPGPVLGMRIGLNRVDRPNEIQNPNDPAVLALLPRGSRIIAQTLTSPTVTGFRPIAQGYLPNGVLAYDPTAIPVPGHENDGVHFYAVYRDDQVLDVTPMMPLGNVKYIR